MTSYNSYDGVAQSASYLLLTEILRNEWDYQGSVLAAFHLSRRSSLTHLLLSVASSPPTLELRTT